MYVLRADGRTTGFAKVDNQSLSKLRPLIPAGSQKKGQQKIIRCVQPGSSRSEGTMLLQMRVGGAFHEARLKTMSEGIVHKVQV